MSVASTPSNALAADQKYISWREHVIDDSRLSGVALRGGDGLVMADLDLDGYLDVVSVHESDTDYDPSDPEYASRADGHVRIAFGTDDPDQWERVTLAAGKEVGAAEDVAVGDLNGDGHPDVVVACELAHLAYFQNPGKLWRTTRWPRVIPRLTVGRGSFIRVFLADLDGDQNLEVVTPNKGNLDPTGNEGPQPISWFAIDGDPLDDSNWVEHELTRVPWPINAQPVDLDGDGDQDVVGGSLAEYRIMWFENLGAASDVRFRERTIEVAGTSLTGHRRPAEYRDHPQALVHGFQWDFVDLSGDGRLDIVLAEGRTSLVWLQQPASSSQPWRLHEIGRYDPDHLAGILVADLNSDGHQDVMTGAYSRGPRNQDGDVTRHDPLGRLAWFEHPGDPHRPWVRHDISRRKRGMFDKFEAHDLDQDGDLDLVFTRGNSGTFDGVYWLEQVRTRNPVRVFQPARHDDSPEIERSEYP